MCYYNNFWRQREFGILATNVVLDKTLSMINFLLSNPQQVHNSLSMMSIILEVILLWFHSPKIFSPTASAKVISSWHKFFFLVARDLHVWTISIIFLTHSWFNLSYILACNLAWITSLFPSFANASLVLPMFVSAKSNVEQ